MSKITRVALPKRGQYHHYLVASDFHSHSIHKPSLEILIKHAKLLPSNDKRLVIAGDFLDAGFLMAKKEEFKKWIKRANCIEEYFLPLAEEEILWGNETIDLLQDHFTHIYLVIGNHDHRYEWFKESHSPDAYKNEFDLSIQLKLKDRGIPLIKNNDWLDIGGLSITHGSRHGNNHNRQHFQMVNKSVLYGHVHHSNCTSFFSRGATKKAWSLPAMCDLNPEYMKNNETNWTNGYASVMMKSNGNFNLHIHELWDDQIILPNGKVLNGKKA